MTSESGMPQASLSDGSLSEVALNDKVEVIEIPESPDVEEAISGVSAKAFTGKRLFISKTLLINPQNGLIEVVNANTGESSGEEFCLKSDQIDELQAILASARICEAQEVMDEDIACTMDYQFPYAKLHLLNQKVSLGEKFSGCHRGADLCGEYSQLMQGFIASILNELPQMSCSFEAL